MILSTEGHVAKRVIRIKEETPPSSTDVKVLVGDLKLLHNASRIPRIRHSNRKALRRDDYALSKKRQLRNVDLVICEGKRVWKTLNLPRMVRRAN